MLRISLDAQIEDLEQHFEAAHLAYLQSTAQRTHDFKDLTIRDQSLSQQIDEKRRKIDNLQVNEILIGICIISTIYIFFTAVNHSTLAIENTSIESRS